MDNIRNISKKESGLTRRNYFIIFCSAYHISDNGNLLNYYKEEAVKFGLKTIDQYLNEGRAIYQIINKLGSQEYPDKLSVKKGLKSFFNNANKYDEKTPANQRILVILLLF